MKDLWLKFKVGRKLMENNHLSKKSFKEQHIVIQKASLSKINEDNLHCGGPVSWFMWKLLQKSLFSNKKSGV